MRWLAIVCLLAAGRAEAGTTDLELGGVIGLGSIAVSGPAADAAMLDSAFGVRFGAFAGFGGWDLAIDAAISQGNASNDHFVQYDLFTWDLFLLRRFTLAEQRLGAGAGQIELYVGAGWQLTSSRSFSMESGGGLAWRLGLAGRMSWPLGRASFFAELTSWRTHLAADGTWTDLDTVDHDPDLELSFTAVWLGVRGELAP
jgi:hypothetical protein